MSGSAPSIPDGPEPDSELRTADGLGAPGGTGCASAANAALVVLGDSTRAQTTSMDSHALTSVRELCIDLLSFRVGRPPRRRDHRTAKKFRNTASEADTVAMGS